MTDSIALPTHLVAVDHATASAILGISPSRLRHHVRLGDVTPHFSGTKPLYAISELERFVEDCRRDPGIFQSSDPPRGGSQSPVRSRRD